MNHPLFGCNGRENHRWALFTMVWGYVAHFHRQSCLSESVPSTPPARPKKLVTNTVVTLLCRPDVRNQRSKHRFQHCGTLDLAPTFEKCSSLITWCTNTFLPSRGPIRPMKRAHFPFGYNGVHFLRRWSRGAGLGNTRWWIPTWCTRYYEGQERDTEGDFTLFPTSRRRKDVGRSWWCLNLSTRPNAFFEVSLDSYFMVILGGLGFDVVEQRSSPIHEWGHYLGRGWACCLWSIRIARESRIPGTGKCVHNSYLSCLMSFNRAPKYMVLVNGGMRTKVTISLSTAGIILGNIFQTTIWVSSLFSTMPMEAFCLKKP